MRRRFFTLFFAASIVFGVQRTSAIICLPYTLADEFKNAHFVYKGRVTGVRMTRYIRQHAIATFRATGVHRVRMEVEQVWRGTPQRQVELYLFDNVRAINVVEKGQSYIVFAHVEPYKNPVYYGVPKNLIAEGKQILTAESGCSIGYLSIPDAESVAPQLNQLAPESYVYEKGKWNKVVKEKAALSR